MKCPHCGSDSINRNGRRGERQNYICKQCGRQFLESVMQRGYPEMVREICIRMHQKGMGFREIERMTGISHNTVILWVRQDQDEKRIEISSLVNDDSDITNSHEESNLD